MAEYKDVELLRKQIAEFKMLVESSENSDYLKSYITGKDAVMEAIDELPAADVQEEENILKFYYCESEDDYYLGQRVDNFYYAKYDKGLHEFIWCMSRFLPWGERVCDERVMWKEYTYPSEPIEIGCYEWLKGFIAKYITADVQEVIRCKDCIYRHSSEFCECREPNFYCADGERMDGDKR